MMTGQKLSEDSFWNVQTNYPQALSLIDTDALTIHHQVYFALLFYECIKESFFFLSVAPPEKRTKASFARSRQKTFLSGFPEVVVLLARPQKRLFET